MSAPSATALIGHTGFVGGTLLRGEKFDALYNSKTIARFRLARIVRLPALFGRRPVRRFGS